MIKVTKKIEQYEICIETDAFLTRENLSIVTEELLGSKVNDTRTS